MKKQILMIFGLFSISIHGWAETASQTQLYTLSDDFLNQRISWKEFNVALLEYKKKSPYDEESLQILISLLNKVQVPKEDQKELLCLQTVSQQSEDLKPIMGCDLLQIPVSELTPQILQNEELYIEGLPIKSLKNLKILLPKGFVQILFRKKDSADQILFVDATNLDWKHIKYNPVFLEGPSMQVQQSQKLLPSPFYQKKIFWVLTAAVLGMAFFKDKELIIEK